MPIEEQAEEKIQNAVQTIITGGAKLMLRIPKGVAMALLRSGMKLTKTGVHAAGRGRQEQDRQRRDVRETIAKEEGRRPARAATRRLDHARGTAQPQDRRHRLPSSERTDQGQFILHFAGKDEDHVRHAVQRAFKGMGLDVTDDDFTVEQTEQTRNEPEPPARETRPNQP